MAAERLPLDTFGGIIQAIDFIRAEARENSSPKKRRQCPAVHTTRTKRGDYNTVFCTHDEGHEGEHKGYRKKWPNEAQRGGEARK